MDAIRLSRCQGQAIAPHLEDLARLRIRVFRDFPYLYDGDLGYEADYLNRYAECPASLFLLAFDGDALVGAATGMPLAAEVADFRAPFEARGLPVDAIFYYGESVLLSDYRGHGIGKAFMAEREAHARREGFTTAAFCAVERPETHPRQPANYTPLHGFWRSRGYARQSALTTTFRWKDLGETDATDKPMVFWLKPLE